MSWISFDEKYTEVPTPVYLLLKHHNPDLLSCLWVKVLFNVASHNGKNGTEGPSNLNYDIILFMSWY